jgi:hypothetical protein
MFKSILTAVTALLFTGSAFAQELPGAHTELCRSELAQMGPGIYSTFDGSWSGLEQTAIVKTEMLSGMAQTDVVILAATPGMAAWGVPEGCTVYKGVMTADGVFTAVTGQRDGETVTYTRTEDSLYGHVVGNGIENQAEMPRNGQNFQVGS